MATYATGALVLYKKAPAIVRHVGEKLEIERSEGTRVRVRPKDIELLHPGPTENLADIDNAPAGELVEAWKILDGQRTNLEELCELAFEVYTPAAAWASWRFAAEGPYFDGDPGELVPATPEAVAERQARESAKAAAVKRSSIPAMITLRSMAHLES